MLKICNWRPGLCVTLGELITSLPSRQEVFKILLKKAIQNANVYSILYSISAFLRIDDEREEKRCIQVGDYFLKLFRYHDFMNFFLIDLVLDWLVETFNQNSLFLDLTIEKNRDLLSIASKFNSRIQSIDSIKTHHIIFSIENLGFMGILENTQKNEFVDKILMTNFKSRAKRLAKLSRGEQVAMSIYRFQDNRQIRNFLFTNMNVLLREETFYEVECKVLRVFRLHLMIQFTSNRNGKHLEKICVLPFDHPCLLHFIQ